MSKLRCGDECQRQVLFLAVQTRRVLSGGVCPQRENESLVYSARYNGQTGEGGRLADRALIRASRGFDKLGGRGMSAGLNRGLEGQCSTRVMLEGSDACCHQHADCNKAHVAMSEVSPLNSSSKLSSVSGQFSFFFPRLPSACFLHMVSVVEHSLTSLRIPPLGIHCEPKI